MQLKLSRGLKARYRARFERYTFEVGILDDKPHRLAKRGVRGLKGDDVLSSYAGGPVRRSSRKNSGLSVAQVSEENRKRLGFNYLRAPFKRRTDDIIKFAKAFFKYTTGGHTSSKSLISDRRRAVNLLQAIVRNPILRGDYGSNKKITVKIKGFDRKMIDTAQLFKAIKARCTVKGGLNV